MAFPRESQEALFAGHVAAFQELGGVPKVIVYDNLSIVVKRVLTGSRREEQREFVAFRSHHLFESSFCRPGEAHEKGLLATSKSGTHWEPRDQGLDGGLVSSLRALL